MMISRHVSPSISRAWKHSAKLFQRNQIRKLHLHEYQAQALLKETGIPIPRGFVAQTVEDVQNAIKELGGKVIIKPQAPLASRQHHIVEAGQDVKGIAASILSHGTGPPDVGPAVSRLYIEESIQFDNKWHLAMTIDRENYCPVVRLRKIEPPHDGTRYGPEKSFDFSITDGISDNIVASISQALRLPGGATENLSRILSGMFKILSKKEAINLETNLLTLNAPASEIFCADSQFFFDDAAQKRQPDLFALRDKSQEIPEEVEAEKSGLVYVKMDGNIGNVVNGAGLAMATNDAISLYGGTSANFLDAGGQATKETMLQAFGIILRDERVKAILVNIYGGITKCDMIAESIIAAASELGPLHVPMVVRLQGTNSHDGLKLLEETDLGIHVEADFGEAARKAVELAK